MADVESTTNRRVSSADFLHASERASADVKSDGKEARDLVSVIEEALEEERTRLMLANSMLGCVQIALDPEAITVAPAVYFPEVLEVSGISHGAFGWGGASYDARRNRPQAAGARTYDDQRQPRAGATWVRIASITCELYSTPS
jgi:hypothetical protein